MTACPVCSCPADAHSYGDDGVSVCAKCGRRGCKKISPKYGYRAPVCDPAAGCPTCGDPSPALPEEPIATTLAIDVSGLGGDEVAVVRYLAEEAVRSLHNGRPKYGELKIDCGRIWGDEEQEEYRDGRIYYAARMVQRARQQGAQVKPRRERDQ